jgi:hypothetical protein
LVLPACGSPITSADYERGSCNPRLFPCPGLGGPP